MFSTKIVQASLGFMFIFLFMTLNACAQWSPGGEMVYMGDLNLAAPSVSGVTAPQAAGGTQMNQPSMNNSTMNNITINNTSMNSSMDNSSMTSSSGLMADSGLSQSSGMKPLDLSNYARDQANNNLAGYTNIMYPISGSRGTTTSTSGGGGGCGGCGGA